MSMMRSLLATVVMIAALPLAAEDFEAFFEDFAARRDNIHSLKAKFLETSVIPDDVFESEGTLTFAKPRRIVRHTEKPFETTFLVDGSKAYQYEPEVAQLVVSDLENDPQAEIIFLGFQSDASRLREAFDITLFDVADDMRGTQGLRLVPKAPEEERLFQEVKLYLRDEDYLPYRIVVETDAESRMILDVDELEVNVSLQPEETQLSLPEGTRIIVDDTLLETVGEGGRRIPLPVVLDPEAEAPAVQAVPLEPVTPEAAEEATP
jgi:outer membrane lipoprotein-sorting protein